MIERNEGSESMYIEINSLKFSQNKDFFDCISGCLAGIVESCKGNFVSHLGKWAELLERYVSSEHDKLYLIQDLEKAVTGTQYQRVFHLAVKVLYDADVVDGDTITEWNKLSSCEEVKGLVINI